MLCSEVLDQRAQLVRFIQHYSTVNVQMLYVLNLVWSSMRVAVKLRAVEDLIALGCVK
eukprot:COSAG02_NODE_127_length_34879_cov_12.705060_34_plen_58_part_00